MMGRENHVNFGWSPQRAAMAEAAFLLWRLSLPKRRRRKMGQEALRAEWRARHRTRWGLR